MRATWVVERTGHRRFPFRIVVERNGRTEFAVRAASPWPGPGQQVFCLRETQLAPDEPLEELERVPVTHLSHLGRKLSIVLDRPTRKRCEFLVVAKDYTNGTGSYEQIFFRTESGIRSHRSRARLELLPRDVSLDIAIDSGERYPWSFPQATVHREKLAVGDYALKHEGRILAVVERKSFDNMLSDLGAIQALHHTLADLSRVERGALVVEAQYADFLNDKRLDGRWPATHVARALAELSVMHPRLPVVYAGSRKLANQWTQRFFTAVATHSGNPQLDLVREAVAEYRALEPEPSIEERVRTALVAREALAFSLAELVALVPDAGPPRVRQVLERLTKAGVVARSGRGRATRWVATRG